MSPLEPIPTEGRDYDLCSTSIHCNADKADAKVFEIQRSHQTPVRVLDFSQKDAEATFRELNRF